MDIGRKQLAILLIVHRFKTVTVGNVQSALETGAYKTVQAALNKLVLKKLLTTQKQRNKLFYSLSESGLAETTPIVEILSHEESIARLAHVLVR